MHSDGKKRPGDVICGCFYIEGELAKTDRFARRGFVSRSAFTPPFETRDSLQERLTGMCDTARVSIINAERIFCCGNK